MGMKSKVIILSVLCVITLPLLYGCTTVKQAKEETENYVESYNSGSIDYEAAVDGLSGIETDNQEVEQYITQKKADLADLRKSKLNYDKAEELYNSEKYGAAIPYYEKVSVNDTNYDDSQNKIKESETKFIEMTVAEAEIYVKDKKYLKAIDVYKSAMKVYDDGSLSGKIEDVEKTYRDYMESEAASYEKEKDWSDAIGIYDELENYFKDDSYKVKKAETKNECINAAIDKAETHTKNNEYDTAKKVINDAINIVGKDVELLDELERISSFEPVSLSDLDEFYKDSDIHKWAGIDKDNTGTSYSSGILLSESGGYMFSDSESSEIEYLLGGKYDKLSGKVVLHYDCKDNSESSAAGKVKIYGDGELLYSSDVVKSGVLPQNFDLNITGVNRLKIEFIWMLTPYGFDMGQIEIGVVTPIVQKSYMSKK